MTCGLPSKVGTAPKAVRNMPIAEKLCLRTGQLSTDKEVVLSVESNVVLVVGDKFDRFADKPGTLTASDLLKSMQRQEYRSMIEPESTVLVPGQGLSHDEMAELLEEAENYEMRQAFEYWEMVMQSPRASKELAHKRKHENVLIGEPLQVDEERFEVDLFIDDENAIMSDHVTGQHLQGMLLIEACRQAFLAITEKYFVPEDADISYYFVINEMNATYNSFSFPVGAKIDYQILESSTDDPSRLSFTVQKDIVQADQVTTQVTTKFTAFDSKDLKPKEEKLAEKTVSHRQDEVGEEVSSRSAAS